MSNKVLEHIAKEYDSVRKGVKSVMGGKVLEYEAKTPNAATLCGTAYCKEMKELWKAGKKVGFLQSEFSRRPEKTLLTQQSRLRRKQDALFRKSQIL
ncbi:MAG: hypothetical protein HFI43_05325 [Lachnospiraceae bacterium]|nr:hypothetical protein [Lachnospiraceae bacterium]